MGTGFEYYSEESGYEIYPSFTQTIALLEEYGATIVNEIPAEDVITVEMGEGRHQDCEKGLASFDGDSEIPMITGDKIVIRKAEVKTRILKLNHLSFVEVLRQKMRDS